MSTAEPRARPKRHRRPQCGGVHRQHDPSPALLALAAAQAGVLSAGQALGHGLTRSSTSRLVDRGAWQRLTPGIFLLGVGEPTWSATAWAGTLLGGDGSRLGYAAAGHLWGLVEEPPRSISVLVPSTRVLEPRGCWRFLRERPGNRSARSPGDPPRTTVEDTVLDLCADATPRELVDLVTRAIQTRRTNARRLLTRAGERERLRHRRLLQEVLGDVAIGAESALEVRYLRDVERRHQLPSARRQHRSVQHGAVRDLRYDAYTLLIELDGRTHIAGRFRDMHRDNAALLDGEVTLRYGWTDVTEQPCQVAREVAGVLTQRGWPGVLTRCSWCAHVV